MKTLNRINQEISARSRAAKHLLAEKGSQSWAPEDQRVFDQHMDEIERLEAQADALPQHAKEMSPLKARHHEGLEIYLRKNVAEMNATERQIVRNTMSTTTPSEGGYAVPSLVASDVVNLLKGYGFMRLVADDITTETGATMNVAASDGTAEVGELVTQNTQATALDPSFQQRALPVYKFSSKIFTVPIELLQDNQVDIVSFVMQRVRDRIGRVQNPYFTTGTGTAQPTGLVTAASVGKAGLTGQTTTIIYDDLIDLIDSLDDAHFGMPSAGTVRPSIEPGWMFSQTTRKVIRKIKDSSGRPIWTPSYDDGTAPGTPGNLLDFPVYMNNDMAAPAANAKTVAFGNLHRYMIRDALDVTLFRFTDSAYMVKGQVGFLGWARSGGNLLDTSAVKLYQHSAT